MEAAARPLGSPMGANSDAVDQGLRNHRVLSSGKRFQTLKPLPVREVADLGVLGAEDALKGAKAATHD